VNPEHILILERTAYSVRLSLAVRLEGQNAITDTTSVSNRRPTATNQLVTKPPPTSSPRAIQATICRLTCS
jgi:DNA transposition AAA+ family ATPase